jgi:hypothetical protein
LGGAVLFAASSTSQANLKIALVRVPDGGIQPQAVMGPGGILHLLYFKGDPKSGDLFYTKSADYGSAWSTPLRVNSTPGSANRAGDHSGWADCRWPKRSDSRRLERLFRRKGEWSVEPGKRPA